MIDIENIVIDTVSAALESLKTEYPKLNVQSMYVDAPSEFPCISVVEVNNSTYRPSHTELLEEHSLITYDVNVYANDPLLKQTAKRIADIADEAMQKLKFTKTMSGQTPNIDRSIYRYTMRYEAIVQRGVDKDGVITYQMYHN